MYHYFQQQPLFPNHLSGALGADVPCAGEAYDKIESGEYEVSTKSGRRDAAGDVGECAAVAACVAAGAVTGGASALAAPLCGAIGELLGEFLADAFEGVGKALGSLFGGGSAERQKARDALVAATMKSYSDAQKVVLGQWQGSLDRTYALYTKLFGKSPSVEYTMLLYTPYIALERIPGTNSLRPLYQGAPPTCYPGKVCVQVLGTAGYKYHNPGSTYSDPGRITKSNRSGVVYCGAKSTSGLGFSASYSTTSSTPRSGGTAQATVNVAPACPSDKLSAYFYAISKLPVMEKYLETLWQAETKVQLKVASMYAEEAAKRELAELQAKDATKRANAEKRLVQYLAKKKKREKEKKERRQRQQWMGLLSQGTWGFLWKPRVR